jgi:hypothetical protein
MSARPLRFGLWKIGKETSWAASVGEDAREHIDRLD